MSVIILNKTMEECPLLGLNRDVLIYMIKHLFIDVALECGFRKEFIKYNRFCFGVKTKCSLCINFANCRSSLIVVPLVIAVLNKKFCAVLKKATFSSIYTVSREGVWGFQVPIRVVECVIRI